MALTYNLTAARRAVFAECRAQGIDEETRHQIIREIGLVASGSSKDMGATACRRVIEHLRKTGHPHPSRTRDNAPWAFIDVAAVEKRPLLRKIRALCIDMGKSKAYAEGVARRQHEGVDRLLEMMNHEELRHVVGALERTRGWKGKAKGQAQ